VVEARIRSYFGNPSYRRWRSPATHVAMVGTPATQAAPSSTHRFLSVALGGAAKMALRERRDVAYQTPITIKKALDRIHQLEYVLPAIQREFVWDTDQICRLFDSLMRRYPIGPFLFWQVEPEHSQDFVFYEFMNRYHERLERHNKRLELPSPRTLVAILDGQQRLTALNIGLNGSYAEKLPWKRYSNLDAYPERELYLELCGREADDDGDLQYRFAFMTSERVAAENGDDTHWYRVRDVLRLPEGAVPLLNYVQEAGIPDQLRMSATEALDRLRGVVADEPTIAFHEEEEQDLDRVLNIFIRVNSAGTPLSYADLLLSIATAQWTERDAREEINSLLDGLNDTRHGFSFERNLVLKAGLVMTDASSISFKVTNFNRENMLRLETEWQRISDALKLAAALLGDFGFSARTLNASSALIPIADYLFQRAAEPSYRTRAEHAEDRERIRKWLIRGQLKAGVWGSGLDTLLLALRQVQRAEGSAQFPREQLEAAMARLGKGLRFGDEELDDLVETGYDRKGRDFSLLALMYPGTDVRNEFHVDHVFPRSRFTPTRLRAAGIADDEIDTFRDRVNRLPNLQLLEGPINIAKQDELPAAWLQGAYPDAAQRGLYLAGHDLEGIPADLHAFAEFYETRRQRMIVKLRTLLDVSAESGAPATV
jgi:hypothetical protein